MALLLAVGIRAFVVQAFFIPTSSMVPTLEVGDRLLVQKAFFNWHDLHEGDIVVFHRPPADTMCIDSGDNVLVKRVIGLPGQRLYSVGSNVFVDGMGIPEPYVTEPLGRAIASKEHPYLVPKGDLYVMGDNRAISCDSRYWGPIHGSSVIGQVVLLWWHNGHPDFHIF